MKNLLLGLLLVTFSFAAMAGQSQTLNYEAAYSDGLGLVESDQQKLNKIIEDIKSSEKKVAIQLQVTRAEGTDYDGEVMRPFRGKQIQLLRGLRLRAYIEHHTQIRAKMEMVEDAEAKANQVTLDILDN